nr:uncharacterized protein LOC132773554 [Anolis sagrei ordinatus]
MSELILCRLEMSGIPDITILQLQAFLHWLFRNLARGRPTFQSSLYPLHNIGLASKAVDGNCNGDWYNIKSCTHTNRDYEPWWYVDLGEEYAIATVVVKNRGDCCGERLQGAQIRVGNYGGNNCKSNFHCGTITDTRAGSISTISCYGFKGRYLKDKKSCLPVHQEGPPTSLVSRMIRIWMGLLATVVILVGHGEAWSCKPELQGHFRNLARGRPAFQSSLYPLHNIGLASKAVDGNCNGDWYNIKSCTHTNRDYEPWWYVDLGEEYAIATVVVKNRGDCCGERLQGAQIRVGNYGGILQSINHSIYISISPPSSPCSCGTITDTRAGSISTISCYGFKGRYVSIIIPNRREWLHVCEVEVYGTKEYSQC